MEGPADASVGCVEDSETETTAATAFERESNCKHTFKRLYIGVQEQDLRGNPTVNTPLNGCTSVYKNKIWEGIQL